MPSTTEQTRAVVQGLYDAGARGDIDALFALVDDDIIQSSPGDFPWTGPHIGAKAWKENGMPFLGEVHELSSMKLELVADGDKCAAVVQVNIKDSEDVVEYVEMWTVSNGKATRLKVYCFDTRPVRRQIEKLGIKV